jgi:hypothetical protein
VDGNENIDHQDMLEASGAFDADDFTREYAAELEAKYQMERLLRPHQNKSMEGWFKGI